MKTMNDRIIIAKTEQYLHDREIRFIRPGRVHQKDKDSVEVVFLVPEVLDKTIAVVEPPDVRVNFNIKTGEIYLVYQM